MDTLGITSIIAAILSAIGSIITVSAVKVKEKREKARYEQTFKTTLAQAFEKTSTAEPSVNFEWLLAAWKTILSQATTETSAVEAAILLYNPSTHMLETQVAIGKNPGLNLKLSIPLSESKGITAWVLHNQRPAKVGDVHTDAEWNHIYLEVNKDTRSELDVPLFRNGKAIGVINLESPSENAFTEAHEASLIELAEKAMLSINLAPVLGRVINQRK